MNTSNALLFFLKFLKIYNESKSETWAPRRVWSSKKDERFRLWKRSPQKSSLIDLIVLGIFAMLPKLLTSKRRKNQTTLSKVKTNEMCCLAPSKGPHGPSQSRPNLAVAH